jgi:hypothetical protein
LFGSTDPDLGRAPQEQDPQKALAAIQGVLMDF